MPHLIVEYSEGLEQALPIDKLVDAVIRAAADSGAMQERDIKARAVAYRHFRLADGGSTFVHTTVRMLAGRAPETKLRLSTLIRERLVATAPDVHSISVEICDMDPDSYRKRVLAGDVKHREIPSHDRRPADMAPYPVEKDE